MLLRTNVSDFGALRMQTDTYSVNSRMLGALAPLNPGQKARIEVYSADEAAQSRIIASGHAVCVYI